MFCTTQQTHYNVCAEFEKIWCREVSLNVPTGYDFQIYMLGRNRCMPDSTYVAKFGGYCTNNIDWIETLFLIGVI